MFQWQNFHLVSKLIEVNGMDFLDNPFPSTSIGFEKHTWKCRGHPLEDIPSTEFELCSRLWHGWILKLVQFWILYMFQQTIMNCFIYIFLFPFNFLLCVCSPCTSNAPSERPWMPTASTKWKQKPKRTCSLVVVFPQAPLRATNVPGQASAGIIQLRNCTMASWGRP